MSKPKLPIVLGDIQRMYLGDLREGFGERGYLILPLAKRFRTHRQDFVAVRKNNGREFLIVHAARRGSATVTPYCLRGQYRDVQELIDELHTDGAGIRWLQQVPLTQPNLTLEHFLSLKGVKEYQKLIAPMQTAGL